MPQSSYVYAVARVRALENGLFSRERLARLAEGSLDDVIRMLNESGYGDMPESTAADCELLIAGELEKANRLVQEITPEPEITNLFLMKADIHNLKVLLKARMLENSDEPSLLGGGVYPKERLQYAVRDRDYRDLPDALKEALVSLEKTLQTRPAPQAVSIALDRAYHELAVSTINNTKSKSVAFVKRYFNALSDFDNVLALLRIRAMGAGKEVLGDVLLPAGDIPHSTLISAFEQPFETMAKLVSTGPVSSAMASGLDEAQRSGQNSALEKARDNYLMRLIKQDKYDVMTLQPVLGYYLAREQEARCIRLIVTAKRNGLDDGVITERLREVYG